GVASGARLASDPREWSRAKLFKENLKAWRAMLRSENERTIDRNHKKADQIHGVLAGRIKNDLDQVENAAEQLAQIKRASKKQRLRKIPAAAEEFQQELMIAMLDIGIQ